MLRVDAEGLYEEIRAAEEVRDKYLRSFGSLVKGYHGPAYNSDMEGDGAAWEPENHVFEYLSLVVPRCVYDNPRVRIKSKRGPIAQMVGQALQHGLNRWIRDTDFRNTLLPIARDTCMSWGVGIIESEETQFDVWSKIRRRWESQTFRRPTVRRLSPRRFGMDPACDSPEFARFQFHRWVRDKNDLIEEAMGDPSWDVAAIEGMSAETGTDKLGRDKDAEIPDRGEVVGYEVWVPEFEMDESPGPDYGFHGTIFTLSLEPGRKDGDENPGFIRAPRPFFGRRTGPYVVSGVYSVPDIPWPLSPLLATYGQQRELNENAKGMSRSMQQYKKIVLVDAANPELAARVRDSKHHYVIPVTGLDKNQVIEVEIGGITPQMIEQFAVLRARLDRASGISDAQRGNSGTGNTATAEAIADESATVRMSFVRQQIERSAKELLTGVGNDLWYDNRVAFPIAGDEAAGFVDPASAMPMAEPWFQGGVMPPDPFSTEPPVRFEDLELDIEPFSMERVSEGQLQAQAQNMIGVATTVGPLIPQIPWVNWKGLLNRYGDVMNDPEYGSLFNVDLAMALGGMMGIGGGQDPGRPQMQSRPRPAGMGGGAGPEATMPAGPGMAGSMMGSTRPQGTRQGNVGGMARNGMIRTNGQRRGDAASQGSRQRAGV